MSVSVLSIFCRRYSVWSQDCERVNPKLIVRFTGEFDVDLTDL